jgi:hypothetical protein
VESACTSAEQLALLDAATRWSTKANPESRAARQRFVESLSTAAGVIESLHLAEVNEGTPASDRVRELNADLRDEASALSQARAELAALLAERR